MYRLLVVMMSAVLVTGCSSQATSDFLSRTGDALSKIGEKTPTVDHDGELQPLFEQPYIDPLTEYLQNHSGDQSREAQLTEVREERDRRCAEVARRYNTDEITETGLALYRRGYSFSCPQDVAAYEARLEALQADTDTNQPTTDQVAERAAQASKQSVQAPDEPRSATKAPMTNEAQATTVSRQLNDCYLLTRIRNFSGALEACRGPADDGVTGAQINMAKIEKALGNHDSAYRWAKRAAPKSGQAAYLLGDMYANGLGVEQDSRTAAKWFTTAVDLGYPEARRALEDLTSVTTDANGY